MKPFSSIEYSFENFKALIQREKFFSPKYIFSENEKTPLARAKRINKVFSDFWEFDKTYFSEALYENYSSPNRMLKDIVNAAFIPGYHLFIGPRKHGKSVTGKKLIIWLALTGKSKISGVYSETLNKSSSFLKDIYRLCVENDRLMFDFELEFDEANSDCLAFYSKANLKDIFDKADIPPFFDVESVRQVKFISSFSEGRSVRGYTRLFYRPNFLLGDDIETLESSFTEEAIRRRIDKLSEAFHSMSDNSTFIILANDFKTNSAVHYLRVRFEENLLDPAWRVYVYKAFEKKPLWIEKFGNISESRLKAILKPTDEADWQANYQANPIEPEGFFFRREYFSTYKSLPRDLKAVVFCDPNLAKKNKGDATAMTVLGYSPSNDKYYVVDAVCRSFSDSNALLNCLFSLKLKYSFIFAIGFDGNVSQESTWTNFVRNWSKINDAPFPVIEYKKYNVNDLAKNLQLVWNEKRILFPEDFSKTQDGQNYLNQLFAFTGEKKSSKDDAPDSLISAFEFLHERKFTKKSSNFKLINDYY